MVLDTIREIYVIRYTGSDYGVPSYVIGRVKRQLLRLIGVFPNPLEDFECLQCTTSLLSFGPGVWECVNRHDTTYVLGS